MKNYMKSTIALMALMLSAASTWAQGTFDTTITLDGARPTVAPGTVEPQIANGVATLTVTASDGYYIEASDITVIKTISGEYAQGRHRAGGNNIADPITLTPSGTVNPTGETVYTFTVTDEKYDYEVTADFHALLDISTATVTLSQTSFTYDGSAKQPAVSSVVLGQTTIASDSYSVSYENNVDAADATDNTPPTVKVTATKIPYTGEAKATFTIAAATMTVTATGYDAAYDGQAHGISVTPPEGATVKYGESATSCTLEASPTYTNAGTYTVYYEVTKANYATVTGSAAVVIEKADVTLKLNVPESPMRLKKGEVLLFNVETEPKDLPVVPSSSYEAIAIVEALDDKGSTFSVTALGSGSATITVTFEGDTNYEDASASFDVTVEGDAIQPITENRQYTFDNPDGYTNPDGSDKPLNGVVIDNILHNINVDEANGYDSEEGCIAIGTPTSPENILRAIEGFANFYDSNIQHPIDPAKPYYLAFLAFLKQWNGFALFIDAPGEGEEGELTVESKEEGPCQMAVQIGASETKMYQHDERQKDLLNVTTEDGKIWRERRNSDRTELRSIPVVICNSVTGDLARTKAIHKGKKSGINAKVYSVTYKVKSTSGIDSVGHETKILSADGWYDLRGQRISQPQQKGIYINNGRKVVIK